MILITATSAPSSLIYVFRNFISFVENANEVTAEIVPISNNPKDILVFHLINYKTTEETLNAEIVNVEILSVLDKLKTLTFVYCCDQLNIILATGFAFLLQKFIFALL